MQPSLDPSELSSCEREPINTPGAVQPHGVLLALRRATGQVTGASANAAHVFGLPARALLGKDLASLLGAAAAAQLRHHVRRGMSNALQPVTLAIPKRQRKDSLLTNWDVFVHKQGGDLLLEFETAAPKNHSSVHYRRLRSTLGQVHSAPDLAQLCGRAARAVRQLTRYDLVMVYRFDHDWNGQVVAEAKRPGLDTYLDHHFPASDIPAQAREAFRSTWVRTIPDVNYQPVPLLQSAGEAPLNMGKALLRSVSPIHVQYLKNMGTQATLTISLVSEGRLWGLIACHHRAPSLLFHETRLACELVGKAVSSLIAPRQRSEEDIEEQALAGHRRALAEGLEGQASVQEGLQEHAEALLACVDAAGAAVRVDADRSWRLLGQTPSPRHVEALARWVDERMGGEAVYATHHLARDYPLGEDICHDASGLMAVQIPNAEQNLIMWFRPEEKQTKVWAGNPHKQVSRLPDGTLKIEPRQSFEGWKESVALRSRPWTRIQMASALAVRSEVMAQDLRRQFELAQQAVRARDDFLSMASHELKTPLTTMRLQTQLTRRRLERGDRGPKPPPLERAMARIDHGIDRLVRLVDDMLDISRISAGKLAIVPEPAELTAIAREVTDRMRDQFDAGQVPLSLEVGAPARGDWDAMRLEQVLWNLLANALRYGAGSPVKVWAGLRDGEALLEVEDGGPGVAAANQTRIFDKFERADAGWDASGLGLGLHICRGIVEVHRGRIGVRPRSQAHPGATFFVALPLRV